MSLLPLRLRGLFCGCYFEGAIGGEVVPAMVLQVVLLVSIQQTGVVLFSCWLSLWSLEPCLRVDGHDLVVKIDVREMIDVTIEIPMYVGEYNGS